MKSAFCLLSLIASAVLCLGQAAKSGATPDLTKFSSDQLTACFTDSRICGSSDIYVISDELANRLPHVSTERLVSCFADWKICGVEDGLASGWPISDELARRGSPHKLLLRYWTEPDQQIRWGIVHVAYHFKTLEIAEFMRKVLAEGKGDGDYLYWPANYLAKQCDPAGLKWISERPQRDEGCIQFQATIPLFGKCHYRPAIPYLINSSLDDACLNIVDAAEVDLTKMYPGSPKRFNGIKEEQRYYCRRANQEGFKLSCDLE